MKKGITLQDMAQTLTAQLETKQDFVARSSALQMTVHNGGLYMMGLGLTVVPGIRPNAHSQIANRLLIPIPYYQRLRESNPNLLADNVNHWLSKDSGKRLLRLMNGDVRAYLSDRYRPIDNYELMEAVLPQIQGSGARVVSSQLTERKLYLKCLFPKMEAEVKRGDVVQMGFSISNSEVGAGSVDVLPLIYRLVCENGMIQPDYGMRRAHLGRLQPEDYNSPLSIFSPETLALDNKAFFAKVSDVMKAVATRETFDELVKNLRETAGHKITADPVQAVENVTSKFNLTKSESGSVLRHLIEGGDLSQYGILNAVTRASQDVDDYDRATELELVGGKIARAREAEWAEVAG